MSEERSKGDYAVSVLSAVTLGIATCLGAFAAYQSTLHGGECLTKYNQGSILINQANSSMQLAVQTMLMDGIAWMEEKTQRTLGTELQQPSRVALADYWRRNLSEDMQAAMTWAEQNDKIPFEHEPYINGRLADAQQLAERGTALFEEGQQANEHGDNFTLVTVLFTIVLFFGGMASVLDRLSLKLVFLFLAWLIMATSIWKLLTLPMAG